MRILRSFLTKGEVPNVVNIGRRSWSRYQLVVRHVDQVGALANVLAVLKRHGINIQELDNTVFEGGRAACAKIRLASRPSDACLSEIMAFSDEVLHVDLDPAEPRLSRGPAPYVSCSSGFLPAADGASVAAVRLAGGIEAAPRFARSSRASFTSTPTSTPTNSTASWW